MGDKMIAAALRDVLNDKRLLWIAYQAIEGELIEHRDRGISMPARAHGVTVRYKNGDEGPVRFGVDFAVSVGLEAVADFLETGVFKY